jgi:alpha-1,2-mannosyltransferase
MPASRKTALAVAGTLVLLCVGLFVLRVRREMQDFQVNDKAGERLIWGESLYRAEDGHYQFKYPPFAAILYVPLAAMPLPLAKAVWFALILAASLGVFVLSLRLARDGTKAAVWVAWLPLLVLGRYFLRELELGQINALITFLLLAMISLLAAAPEKASPGTETAAGLLWGLSVALKPYALIFLPYFLLRKKVRTLVAGSITLAAAFIVPAFFYGFRGNLAVHKEWVRTLSRSTPGLLTSQDNASLLALFAKWTGQPGLAARLWAGGLVVLALLTFLAVRKGRRVQAPVPLEGALLLLLIPLVSPLGWDYTFLSAVPAVALIARRFRDLTAPLRAAAAAAFLIIPLSLYDLLGRRTYARFMSFSVITLCFLCLAGALFFLRFRDVR